MLLLAQSDHAHTLPAALLSKAEQLQQQFSTNFNKPRNIKAKLRDYQTDGYQWMQRLMNCGLGACLADDMGLGKTLQVICVLLARAADGPSSSLPRPPFAITGAPRLPSLPLPSMFTN